MSDTPRTDAEGERNKVGTPYSVCVKESVRPFKSDYVAIAFARQLERELAEARRHLQEVVDAYDNSKPMEIVDYEMRDAIIRAETYLKGGL